MITVSEGQAVAERRSSTLMWEYKSWSGYRRLLVAPLTQAELDLDGARFVNFRKKSQEFEVPLSFATRIYLPYDTSKRDLRDIATDAFEWIARSADSLWSFRIDIVSRVVGEIVFTFADDATATVFALLNSGRVE